MFLLLLLSLVVSFQPISLKDPTGDAVSRFLRNLTFNLPDQDIDQKEGLITIKGTMKNITCGSISMVDFDITSGQSDTTNTGFIDLLADGLTLDCDLIMDLVEPMPIAGNTDVSVEYTDKKDSYMNFRTEFGFNSLGVPTIAALPGDDCGVALDFVIVIEGSKWPAWLITVVEDVMKAVLKRKAPTLLCDELRKVVDTNVTQVLETVAGYLDPMLNNTEGPFEPENPPALPKNVEYINFEEDYALKVLDWFIDKNVNGKPMIDRLIDLVVPNGVVSKSFQLTPIDGIRADLDLELFTLDSFSIFDVLTPVSKSEFPDYHPNNQSLYFHIKLDTLGFNVSGTLTNISTNATTPFAATSSMSELETKLIVQIGMEPLKDIVNLPQFSIDCLLTLSHGSTVQLLDFSVASMNPLKISSPNGLLMLGDEMANAIEMLYGGVLLDLVHGMVGTTVRVFVNKLLKIIHELEPGCDPRPTPAPKHQLSQAYWIETISCVCVVAFIVLCGLVYLVRNKRRQSESQAYTDNLLEDTRVVNQ